MTDAVKQQFKKGEDAYAVLKGGQSSASADCYSVFDGHGGADGFGASCMLNARERENAEE